MSTGRRLLMAAFIIGGAIAVAPGVALAHTPTVTPSSRCVEGGWEATVTISFSVPGPLITGMTTSSHPAGSPPTSWQLAPDETRTFGGGVTIPFDVASVTFTVEATWSADGQKRSESRTLTRPEGCVEPTTTTTSPSTTTTTTTIEGALSITAITPICVSDVPFIQVTFGNEPQFDGRAATVTFIDKNGTVVATHTATYVANGSVTFVYPGATVDAAGRATDWPGWVFDGDEWVPDPTDSYLRDGLTVRVEVNPTATGQVSYPPMTSACANPQQGVSPEQGVFPAPAAAGPQGASSALPVTGSATEPTFAVAAAAVAFGAAAMVLARRRPSRRP